MKILLLQDVRGIGRKMEVRTVSDGYARNFLFPRKLAVPASSEALQMKEREEHKQEGNLAHLEALKKKLEGINLEFPVKTSVRGEIFSSVTEHDIERSLAAHGVRPAKAVLQKPLRMLGGHEARIEFGYGVTGTIKITLKPTKEE